MISGEYISALRRDGVVAEGEDVYVGDELVVIGIEARPLVADKVMLEDVTFAKPRALARLVVYLDGAGAADAGQLVRPVLYAENALLASGPAYMVPDGAPAQWLSFDFDDTGQIIPGGPYRFGIHTGPVDEAARYYQADTAGSFRVITAPFADGPPPTVTTGSLRALPMLMYLETLTPVAPSGSVTDDYIAGLPFDLAQRIFASGTVRASRLSAVAGWYGSGFDATSGAHAIARKDGRLTDRVGERLRIRRRGPLAERSVNVYVHDEREFPDELETEDLLLSARAFLALGNLGLDTADVIVETLA